MGGLFAAYEDSQGLPRNVAVSATLINVYRSNLQLIDRISRLGRHAFQGGWGNPQERGGVNPYREWWGAFRVVPGITGITFVMRATGFISPNDRLQLYLDGVLHHSFAIAAGTQTYSIGLPGGLSVNQVVDVQLNIARLGDLPEITWDAIFELRDGYVAPVQTSASWPGVPSFTVDPFSTVISGDKFDQLADAIDYLARQIGLRTEPLYQSLIRQTGPFEGQDTVRWDGGTVRSANVDRLKAFGLVIVFNSAQVEQVRIFINGGLADTYAVPTTIGEHSWAFDLDVSGYALDSQLDIVIDHVRLAGGGNDEGPLNRFTLYRVFTEQTSIGAIGYPLPLEINAAYGIVYFISVLAALSAIADVLKARIDASPDLWQRQRLFRRRYAYDDKQNEWYEPGMLASRFGREGEVLFVKGKGLTLGYGSIAWEEDATKLNEVGLYNFTALRQESIADGDAISTRIVYLDNVEGLFGGVPYHVRGVDLNYAAETMIADVR